MKWGICCIIMTVISTVVSIHYKPKSQASAKKIENRIFFFAIVLTTLCGWFFFLTQRKSPNQVDFCFREVFFLILFRFRFLYLNKQRFCWFFEKKSSSKNTKSEEKIKLLSGRHSFSFASDVFVFGALIKAFVNYTRGVKFEQIRNQNILVRSPSHSPSLSRQTKA